MDDRVCFNMSASPGILEYAVSIALFLEDAADLRLNAFWWDESKNSVMNGYLRILLSYRTVRQLIQPWRQVVI